MKNETIIEKAIRLAGRANKREKMPVFIHLTAYGPKMNYKHIGTYSQPVLMVDKGKVFEVDSYGNHFKYNFLGNV